MLLLDELKKDPDYVQQQLKNSFSLQYLHMAQYGYGSVKIMVMDNQKSEQDANSSFLYESLICQHKSTTSFISNSWYGATNVYLHWWDVALGFITVKEQLSC